MSNLDDATVAVQLDCPAALSSRYPTLTLYDRDEETWTKLHLGCGGIYLTDSGTGYINIDATGELARERPDRVRQNATDIRDYYARLNGSYGHLPQRRANLVDQIGDLIDPPFEPNTVDKIVCIQALEHLPLANIATAFMKWWSILKPGGVVVVSIPAMNETLEWLASPAPATRDFAIRHLRGSARDEFNHHRAWLNYHDLVWLLRQNGFDSIVGLPNFHLYPAIVMRARKLDSFVPDRSYQFPLPEYDAETCASVLDVGPGQYPLSIATHCFDASERYREFRKVPADIGSIEQMPYLTQSYDYVYASHVLEHVEHPAHALAELQRVGKRGFVETPTAMLDWLMQHGEAHQDADGKPARWMCLPIPNGIVFVERAPEFLHGFTDETFGKWAHRITQYRIVLSEPERYLREMFWQTQDVLNAQASWNESKHVIAVEVRANGDTARDWFAENAWSAAKNNTESLIAR